MFKEKWPFEQSDWVQSATNKELRLHPWPIFRLAMDVMPSRRTVLHRNNNRI